jgi:glycosyltransferase involved in cell wall biosynthesis
VAGTLFITKDKTTMPSLLFIAGDAGYFLLHRLPVAKAAKAAGFDVHVAAPAGEKSTAITAHGFIFHPISLTRGGCNPVREVLALLSLIRLLRRIRPDVVHLISIKPVLYGGIAARLAGCPGVVAAISGLGFVFSSGNFKATVLRFLVIQLYRVALKHPRLSVIFENNDDARIISRLVALAPEKICLSHVGVDLTEYSLGSLPPVAEQPIVVLAARLLKPKGVQEFVDAARQLRDRGIKARFALVGLPDAGNPETVSDDFIAACVREGVVEHWGYRKDMPEVLRQSSLVVLPSYYREGRPKVLLEAAAVGRAVITADTPGCRDAIIPGVTGLLVPPRDAGALADAVSQLLSDRERLQAMGKAGRELAEREFDVRGVVDRHLEIYWGLLAEKEML